MNTPVPQRRALLRNMMSASIATTLSVGALAALPAGTSIPFQVPERPDLNISWLKSVSLSRQLVPAGQEITGTVVLKRAAFSTMRIDFMLQGEAIRTGESGEQVGNGALLFPAVSIRPGEDRLNFRIGTFRPWDGSTNPRSFGINVYLGGESLQTGFTVVPLPLQLPRPPLP